MGLISIIHCIGDKEEKGEKQVNKRAYAKVRFRLNKFHNMQIGSLETNYLNIHCFQIEKKL